MMAKLDNNGPFQFFFTLSCADILWDENITAVLEERGLKINYGFDESGEEKTLVGVPEEDGVKWTPLREYLDTEMDESLHETLRRNVVGKENSYKKY